MAKKPQIHCYSDLKSFQRLMLLITTMVNYPGIGCLENTENQKNQIHHNALDLLRQRIVVIAKSISSQHNNFLTGENELVADFPLPATATLRKDLEILKGFGILEPRMYRWGYYLGTGVMDKQQLKIAFDALESMAIYQGDTFARECYTILTQRIRGLEFESQSDFSYPIRRNLNQAIEYTDPLQMMNKSQNRQTLFHYIPQLEEAIALGQTIQISRKSDLYNQQPKKPKIGLEQVIPLQLIYYNISWYLLYENSQNNQLIIGRISRFANYYRVISAVGRDTKAQQESLKKANKLLSNGWGLNLGNLEAQKQELDKKLKLEKIKVRFYPPVCDFILEGELRHPKQTIKQIKNEYGKLIYLDYSINLPSRSLKEFRFWLQRYGGSVEVIYPLSLRNEHIQEIKNSCGHYDISID